MVKVDLDFEIFSTFALYSAILMGKLLLMPLLTARQRLSKKVFANPEDKAFAPKTECKVKTDDPDVERTRRAHLNDLENILPFFPIACLYCFTGPDAGFAKCLFQGFTAARFAHTVFYLFKPFRSPWLRFLFCFAAWNINVYMVFSILTHFI